MNFHLLEKYHPSLGTLGPRLVCAHTSSLCAHTSSPCACTIGRGNTQSKSLSPARVGEWGGRGSYMTLAVFFLTPQDSWGPGTHLSSLFQCKWSTLPTALGIRYQWSPTRSRFLSKEPSCSKPRGGPAEGEVKEGRPGLHPRELPEEPPPGDVEA